MGVGLAERLRKITASAIWGAELTLSGELIIVRGDFMPLEQKMVDNLDLEDSLKNLQQLCPKIQIKKVMGLADYTVKIFAEGCSIPIGDICEPLRECLTDFARRVYENDEFSLRLNVTGSVQDAEQIMEIRFLNKGVCVSYKIVSSEKRMGRICSLRRSLVSKIEGDSI